MSSSSRPSIVRLVTGVVTFLAAIAVALVGFDMLITALDTNGYGTSEVRRALIWLGIAGAGIGTGLCLLIWEFTVRQTGSK